MSYMTHRSDILSVMYTSKNLYTAGIPSMLKLCIQLYLKPKISSFCDFILADAPARRARHIHHLDFGVRLDEIDDEELAKNFAQVLKQATRLKKLELNQCGEFLSASIEGIVEAFAQLKSVKTLALYQPDIVTCDIVKKMQAPVEDVSLFISDGFSDPVWILSAFQSSLCRLNTRNPFFSHIDNGIAYPKMHTLHATFRGNIDIEPMIRAFPNLRRLSLHHDHLQLTPASKRSMICWTGSISLFQSLS